MSQSCSYDLIVIGSGPGGYVSAIKAAQLGLKTAVIEKEKPGGVCLNIGCIPSKALIHQAGIYNSIKNLEEMGIKVDRDGFDYGKVFKKSRKAADTLSRGVQFLLKKNSIDYVQGEAKISGSNEITLGGGQKLNAKFILIATGATPREIPGFEFDEETVLSSSGALMLEKLPKSLIILGGGAIGVEFAYIMSSFGVKVHIVEMLDRILPMEDEEVVQTLLRSFKKRGIKVSAGTKAKSMQKIEGGLNLAIEAKDGSESVLEAEKILVAVGRTPSSLSIGLENVGISTEKGFIPVGDYYMTKVPSIYAIGDVINSPMLAHVASKEGEIAVMHMAGENPPLKIDPETIPSAIYSEPQIASFGYNEERAKKEGLDYKTASVTYRACGKAVATEQSEGFVKIVYATGTNKILGAHVIGAEATELVHEILLAKTAELLPEDIADMIHAHPTLSETVMESMRAVLGRAVHI